MNKLFIVSFLSLFFCVANAQNIGQSLPSALPENLANSILLQQAPWVQLNQNNVILGAHRQSTIGNHYLFNQTHQGILVYGATYKINIGLNQQVLSIFNGFEPIEKILPLPGNWMPLVGKNWVWLKQNDAWQLAERKIVRNSLGEAEELLLAAENGELLMQNILDLNLRKDTLVRTKVFNPDPLTSAQKEYGENGLYKNNSGANSAELAAELKDKFISISWQNDTFYPWSRYVTIRDLESPAQNVFSSTVANFDFNRSQTQFRELNCLYHIETFRRYLAQIGLPFEDMNPIDVDPTAYSGQDQSRFSYSIDEPALFFGTGGVPDAEDADVIIHEYTHYLNYYLAPNTVNGNERLAVEEANCDFMACMHSKAISNFNWKRIFNWDGYNEFWAGRDGNSANTYPKDVSTDFYKTSLIWSSMLNDLSDDLGREIVTKLLLQSVYSYANNMSMQEAVNLLVQADSALYNNSHFWPLKARFEARGFAITGLPNQSKSDLGVNIINSAGFALGTTSLKIESKSGEKLKYSLYNVQGYLIKQSEDFKEQIEISPNSLPSGMYIINLSNEKGQVHSTRVIVY